MLRPTMLTNKLLLNGVNTVPKSILVLTAVFSLLACTSTGSNKANLNQLNDNSISTSEEFTVQLLGINDFHGQIPDIEQAGGMYQLARHLLAAISNTEEQSFVLHAGDHVGASPAESALLQDEPAIDFLNIMQRYCQALSPNPCQIIGAAGNHEFDEGSDEMLRLLNGGNHKNGPFIHPKWEGSNYLTLGANVRDVKTGELILPPYVVHEVNGVAIGFIGITLDITPEMVIPGIVNNLVFEDQAEVVTHYTNKLNNEGVNAIVVIVHDGSRDDYYTGNTSSAGSIQMDSRFGQFVQQLPDAVDIIVSGHSHDFTNAYVNNKNGEQFLVTQAFSSGRAYSDISITINKQSKDIVSATAKVVMTDPRLPLELKPSAQATLSQVAQLKYASINYAKEVSEQIIGVYQAQVGDILLGKFIADSHMHALQTDLAIMNRGGVRARLKEGEVSWGDLFAIQPFSNALLERRYTGEQLLGLISEEAHWSSNVTIDENGNISLSGQSIVPDKLYSVAGNAFILSSERFNEGELVVGDDTNASGIDVDAIISYIKTFEMPFSLSAK
jgi:5'-nucleotidase